MRAGLAPALPDPGSRDIAVPREDVDRVVGAWAAVGIAASTRRTYVQAFKGFHEFLAARKAAEIEAAFGVRLESPLDEFNAARYVACESASAEAPPSAARPLPAELADRALGVQLPLLLKVHPPERRRGWSRGPAQSPGPPVIRA